MEAAGRQSRAKNKTGEKQPQGRFHQSKAAASSNTLLCIQEAQLMLTNPRDAFRGQSRSLNIVPFHMLGIVCYCAIVTLSLRCVPFLIFDFKKCRDLEIRVRGHSSYGIVEFNVPLDTV